MGKNPDEDILILEAGANTYNNMGRINGIYANDDILMLIRLIRTAEATLASSQQKPSIKVDFNDPTQANSMMELSASTALQRVADELAELPPKLHGQYVRYIRERSREVSELLRGKK